MFLISSMMKYTSSTKIQEVTSKLEDYAQEFFSKESTKLLKIKSIGEASPKVSDLTKFIRGE